MRAESSLKENGLGQIIVGAGVEALHAVFDAAALCEHQDGQAGALQAEMAQHAYAIELRQIQVEDHQVVVKLAAHGARLLAVFHHIHRVVLALQALAYEPGQSCIVFRNQNPHKWALITERF